MMSKKLPNLFFAGEILDVDGITGGFNFQQAWTSGWIATKQLFRYEQCREIILSPYQTLEFLFPGLQD